MSHHGHEDSMNKFYEDGDKARLPVAESQLSSAIQLIRQIAKNQIADPSCTCDTWLEKNGYESEAARKAAKALRKRELDVQIAKLQDEREKL